MAKTTKAAAVVDQPKRRTAPDFSGVPGELVSLEGIDLIFGKCRVSPYDVLLDQLAAATDQAVADKNPRPGLRFGLVKARASVWARAKVKGLRVSFAELGGALYVRMEGRADDDTREQRRAAIRKLLAPMMPLTHIVLANKLREAGDISIDAATVDAIMLQMMKAGEVVRQEGGAWKLNPAKKAVANA